MVRLRGEMQAPVIGSSRKISNHYPECQRFFFRFCGEAAIVSGEASIEIMAIAASPLTITTLPRKKKIPGTQDTHERILQEISHDEDILTIISLFRC